MNVFIGSGQALVTAGIAATLTTTADAYDPTLPHLSLQGTGTSVDVTNAVSGGTLGGLLQFRDTMLVDARNALGQVAVAVATLFNGQHAAGLDLSGQFGGQFFAVGGVRTLPAADNAGSAAVTVTRGDIGGLTTADYTLRYDGSAWSLTRNDTGAAVALTGSGTGADPYVADGLQFVVAGSAQAGDRFQIQPTSQAISGLGVLVSDPAKIAAAAAACDLQLRRPTRAPAAISDASVSDPSAWVRGSYTLAFDATRRLADHRLRQRDRRLRQQLHRWRRDHLQRHVDQPERHAGIRRPLHDQRHRQRARRQPQRAAARRRARPGGPRRRHASIQGAVGQFISGIGVQTNQAQTGRDAQQVVMDDASGQLDSVAGVNLDEEAANLLRYQQAYQAAAKVITVANDLFQTLLDATRS